MSLTCAMGTLGGTPTNPYKHRSRADAYSTRDMSLWSITHQRTLAASADAAVARAVAALEARRYASSAMTRCQLQWLQHRRIHGMRKRLRCSLVRNYDGVVQGD